VYYWTKHARHTIIRFSTVNIDKRAIRLALLVMSGLETNPGPRRPKFPCGICSRACKKDCIACDQCDLWLHKSCIGMSTSELTPIGELTEEWKCPACRAINTSSVLYVPVDPSGPLSDQNENLASISLDHSSSVDSFSNISHISYDTLPNMSGSMSPTLIVDSAPKTSSPKTYPKPKRRFNQLRVLNINFQSIKKKGRLLDAIITSSEPDIIIGTETWLTQDIHSLISSDLGFVIHRRDRQTDAHGGVMIATRRELMISNVTNSPTLELISGTIKLENNKKAVIAAFYRPPKRVEQPYLDKVYDEISALRSKYKTAVMIVGGDFNLPDIEWTRPSIIGSQYPLRVNQAFLNLVADSNLEQQVNFPTRKENTLDLILTSHPGFKVRCKPIPSIGNSDHDIVLFDTAISPQRKKPPKRKIWLWKQAKLEEIRKDIKEFSLEPHNKDVDADWNEFSAMINDTIIRNVPSKMTQARSTLPWMTGNIKRAIKRKQKAHKKARTSKRKRDCDRYKRLQQEVRYMLREANTKYMREVVSENQTGNSKRFWSFVKGKRQENSGVPPLKDAQGYLRSEASAKADILNRQFHSVYTREKEGNMPNLGQQCYPTMDHIRVNIHGVHKLLRELDPHKAPGPDNIPPFILKEASEEIAPILTRLFQRSLDSGVVPEDWKQATIVPAYKKGDRQQASNYRPISLTSVCCKILEHIVHSTIMRHYEKEGILCDNQHGFRKRRSCETQLIITLEEIARKYARGDQVDVILLDFAKAFDKVPHQRLLHKLKFYGINQRTATWIGDFLSDRTQRVVVDGAVSEKLEVISGVPQGTVLGPLLFLTFINDMPSWTKNSYTKLFADDTLLFRTIKTKNDAKLLQNDLSALEQWESLWQMEFNPSKSTVIRINPSKSKCLETVYTLHGESLATSDASKYLGVTIKSDLGWDTHIEGLVGKANRNLGFLRRNFRTCTRAVKAETYTTMVRSSLEYAAAVWDPVQTVLIKQIEQVQRRAARFVCSNYTDRTPGCVTKMLDDLKWETLETRRRHIRLNMLFKILHGQVDVHKDTYLQAGDRRTRGQTRLYQESITNATHFNSFFPKTIREWNGLPSEIVDSGSLEIFRKRLKAGGHQETTH
jgi:hypothetical protein